MPTEPPVLNGLQGVRQNRSKVVLSQKSVTLMVFPLVRASDSENGSEKVDYTAAPE